MEKREGGGFAAADTMRTNLLNWCNLVSISKNVRLWGSKNLLIFSIEEGILEAKTECYAKDIVKSPPFFQSFYDNF